MMKKYNFFSNNIYIYIYFFFFENDSNKNFQLPIKKGKLSHRLEERVKTMKQMQ